MERTIFKATNRRAEAAETAMRGWINSPGHRAKMLAKQPTHLGVGVAQAANGAYYKHPGLHLAELIHPGSATDGGLVSPVDPPVP
jgi:hypothetical protein